MKVGNSDLGLETVVTFSVAAVALYSMWSQMDTVSKCLVALFIGIAALSIHSGTWTQNHRDLRRQARDERREAYGHVKKMIFGKSKQR